ncbi:ARM repeat-containing protein [Rhizodiscina lignyota]|uniref:ARM repeat-containing protein n=1 Tax=Rhizodiscina lignyota TaxID=1504668 RepID=A0A9P4IMW7_9PEZI|nr:ARM repeat-containing protein [Rhizodiscina lignyota]
MEPISRISNILDAARELTIEAGALSSARKSSTRVLPAAQIKKLLDSKHERDVLEGLRRVIAMDYRNLPTLTYFTPIIKNIASPSLEVKKLVYTYLLAHAEAEPQNALMSINTIVRSLSDPNPQLRALALRVMSGIRVPEVSQIVSLYIKRSVGDMSPFVRRAAALAIPKCYRLDPAQLPELLGYLETLLGDRQYYVTAAAVIAFNEICPERIDLIHKHYRSLIRKLVDMDEWGQLATLKLMTVYARKCFPRRTRKVKKKRRDESDITKASTTDPIKGFYDDEPASEADSGLVEEEEIILDPDLALLLRALHPLLNSRNSPVILAVARTYVYLAPPPPQSAYISSSIPPLVALLRGPVSERAIALTNMVQICLAHPEPFLPYYTHFLISHNDEPDARGLKLEILTLLFPHASAAQRSLILAELAHFSQSTDPGLVRDAVRALGRCAQASSDSDGSGATSAKCLRLLLAQLNSPHAALVAESLEVIRHLIQRDPQAHRGTVIQLAKNLDTLTASQARASIVWLVGEFATLDAENNVAADVLRILVKGFADEDEGVKMQIVLLGAKVYLHWLNSQPKEQTDSMKEVGNGGSDTMVSSTPIPQLEEDGGWGSMENDQTSQNESKEASAATSSDPIPTLWMYILLLTRYDTSYDLRDRARLYKSLLSHPSSTSLASLLLLAPKPVPHVPSPGENKAGYALGSASLALGTEAGLGSQGVRGYESVPAWIKEGEQPDARLRDDESSGGTQNRSALPAGDRLDNATRQDIGVSSGIAGKANGVKEKTLDDWLAEDEDDAEDDTEEGETEEETEEESEEETSEESEEDDSDIEAKESQRLVP